MNQLTTVTTKGQVTIPEAVRQQLGISIGDKVTFVRVEKEKKEATIRIIPTNIVDQLAGSLKSAVGYVPHKKARQITARERAKRYT